MSEMDVGKIHETKVNYKKLLQDLRDQYPFDPLSTLIIETFANSLDAGATHIDIYIDEESYKIRDNGKGMSDYEFREYHNIASLTKVKGMGGIGFAGVGAKIYLDRAEYIYTETKSTSFYGASKWSFNDGVPLWEVVYPRGVIDKTGTFIEVKLNSQDKGKITEDFVIKTLQEHYNAVLLGFYKVKEVKVNGRRIEAWMPDQIEDRFDFEFKIGHHKVIGFFIKAKSEMPEEFQGISVAVYGKTVHKNEWFKQFALHSEKITGTILADYLITIVNTSKTQLTRTSMLWKKFHAKVSLEFSRWLDRIGAKLNPPKISPDTSNMIKQLEKSINDVILNTPEFLDLANMLFQNSAERITVIQNDMGHSLGTEVDGSQTVSGTLTGPTEGEGAKTIGPDGGKGITENDTGNIRAERVRRRMKAGIKIGFYEKPDNPNEGWIDPASQTVTINTGHPAYKIASGLSVKGGVYHVWVYHLLRVVIKTLSKEIEESFDTVENKILSEWYRKSIEDEVKHQINKWFPTNNVEVQQGSRNA
ncbi:MAG: ATP-binding protein [Candidatus Bathyarchaeia archaeon]